jgi:NAD(P)H-hydrate epimerase
MAAVSCSEMRRLEQAAFAGGATPEGLMDRAGAAIGRAIARRHPRPGTAIAFIGKGNNGGDALVALAVLGELGWRIRVRRAVDEIEMGVLPRRKLRALAGRLDERSAIDPGPLVVLDGLLGIGARGPVRAPLDRLAAEIGRLRDERGAHVVAVDIPSGVDGDSGERHPGAVRAELTLTVGVAKRGLLEPAAASHVGRIEVIPLDELAAPGGGELRLITPHTLDLRPEPRPFEIHKGRAGRVGVIAGGPGASGAAILCGHAALRAGAGLVTLLVPVPVHDRIAAAAPPELMVRPWTTVDDVMAAGFDALAVGPGLGPVPRPELLELLERADRPLVLDADGLNQLAAAARLDLVRPSMVLTPHPGEFARLAPDLAGRPPIDAARAFVARHPSQLLLKGARSVVAGAAGPCWVNSTGTPGMATAGQGDVLTGVIAALAAGGAAPGAAAALAAWLCGRASEHAIIGLGQSAHSLCAGDTLACIGRAFTDWREQLA